MNPLKKAAAISTLSLALILPGIAQADSTKPMDSGMNSNKDSSMMMDSKMMDNSKHNGMMMMNGMAYVPLRLLAETLGYTLTWNGADQSITMTYMGMTQSMDMDMADKTNETMNDRYMVKVMLNSKDVMIGMDKRMLAHAPMNMGGITYVTKEFVNMYLLAPFMMKSM
ncbi:stalk domain-containing protein [Paenibacillus ihuae]|uniref:stalk domain-containing protein n=1 Tax=Paenibacillus ihuae TaxID=1232431 RepID=UPI0006D576C4|nr:stalk domain-containing protein [Paenibacillus ihuae]